MRINKGFTLIEVLVVLVIVAIITAVAVLSFGHFGQSRREKIIVEQFTQTMIVAQEQAIITPVILRLMITARGYHFQQYAPSAVHDKQSWWALSDDVISHPSVFRRLFHVTFKAQNANAKSILFLPSGFVTPFALVLIGLSHRYTVLVSNNGSVSTKIVTFQKSARA